MPLQELNPSSGSNPYGMGSTLGGAATLASLFLPASGTSSTTGSGSTNTNGNASTNGSVTTSEGVSDAGVKQLIDNILSGNQGLAAVAGGQKQAGLYNSSTNQLLINNLVTQAAGQAALLNKTTTTQTNNNQATNQVATNTTAQNTNTTQAARVSPKTAGVGLGLLQLAGTGVGKSVLSKLGLGSGTGTPNVQPGVPVNPNANNPSGSLTAPDSGNAPSTPNISATSPAASIATTLGSGPADSSGVADNTQSILGTPTFGNGSFNIGGDLTGGFGSTTDIGTGLSGGDLGVGSNLSSGDLSSGGGNVDNTFLSGDGSMLDGSTSLADGAGLGDSLGDTSNITGVDWATSAIDPSAGFNFDPSSFGFAKGGLISTPKRFASGGMVGNAARVLVGDGAAEAAFSSGGDEKAPATTGTQNSSTSSSDNKPVSTSTAAPTEPAYHNMAADIITAIKKHFATGGMVSGNDSQLGKTQSTGNYSQTRPGRMVMPVFAKGGFVNGKAIKQVMNRYANGGMIDLTNTGLQINPNGQQSGDPMGITSDSQIIAPDATQQPQQNTPAAIPVTPTPATSTPVAKIVPKNSGTGSTNSGGLKNTPISDALNPDTDGSTTTSGTTSGQVGTPSQNAAAVNGMGLAALGAITGVPGLATVANALGITNTSMSPISNLASFVSHSLGLGTSSDNTSVAAPGVDGISAPSVSVDGVTTMGASTPAQGLDNAVNDALASLPSLSTASSSASGDAPGEGDGIGGTGDSAGDAGSGDGGDGGASGDGSGSGGDSASAATGKYIEGAGTSTSDSIPAWLSDGEYVLNADAVKAIGPDVLDKINDLFKPSPGKLAQGRAIHQAQFGAQ